MPNGWYSLTQNKDKDADYAAELFIYDEIGGWGVSANQLIGQLKGIKGRLLLRLNTPGGSVFEAVALYNYLKGRKGGIDTVVDGWALSAGSFLLLAGEQRTMGEAAMLMVHSAWGMAVGNGDDLRKQADLLDKVNAQIKTIYTSVTGQAEAVVDEWLSSTEGHWFSADEAIELGFATKTAASQKIAAKFDSAVFAARFNAPAAALESFSPTESELMKIEQLQASLDAANAQIAEISAKLATAESELATTNAALADATAQHEQAKALVAAERQKRIAASIDALVATKRVKAEGKDAMLAACVAAADDGAAIIAAIPEERRGHDGLEQPLSLGLGAGAGAAAKPTATRAQFETMSQADRMSFSKSGGRITD